MKSIPAAVTRDLMRKVVTMCVAVSLLSSFVIVTLYYSRSSTTLLDVSIEGLAEQTRLMGLRFRDAYGLAAADARIVADGDLVKQVQAGMSEPENLPFSPSDTTAGKAFPPADQLVEARADLAENFKAIMRERTHYTVMRFVGLRDRAREVVRVERTSNGFNVAADQDLQTVESLPYIRAARNLAPGELQFSQAGESLVTRDGYGQSIRIPTMRMVVPVHANDGQLFGLIIINAEYGALISRILSGSGADKEIALLNIGGDYVSFSAAGESRTGQAALETSKILPVDTDSLLDMAMEDGAYFHGDRVSYFSRLSLDPLHPDTDLGLILSASRKNLLQGTRVTGRDSILLALVLVVVTGAGTWFASRRLTSPLTARFHDLVDNLWESEAKAQAVLETAVDGIITIDRYGTIDSFNPACEKIFGYQRHEVIGRNVGMLMPEKYRERHDSYLENYQKTGVRQIIGIGREMMGQRKNGVLFPLDLAVSETVIENRQIYTGIVRDITERKQIEMMKNEFISIVNHELRTPLTSIQASLGLLRVKAQHLLDDKGKRLLEISYENCGSLAHLVNDILDIEKIAAGKMEFEKEICEIRPLVESAVAKNFSYADKYKVSFVLREGGQGIWCEVDKARFNQAMLNLLSNAAKFSPPGEEVTVSIMGLGDGRVRISVADHGPGIPASFRDKIFDRFAQADSSSTRAKGGSGLGLNITKSIIEAFGGTVSFDTVEGKGTTFHFQLPMRDGGAATSEVTKKWARA